MVNVVFREPVHQVLEKIKNEPFFKWPNKIGGDLMRRNQSLHCQYHQDCWHTIEDCRILWDHLDQLVQEGKLKQFLYHPSGQGGQAGSEPRRDASSRAIFNMINVILVVLGRTSSHPSKVMSVAQLPIKDFEHESKSARVEIRPMLSFSDDDKAGTPYNHMMMSWLSPLK